MSFKKPRIKESKSKTVTIISLLEEAITKKSVYEKGLVLEKTKNHEIYPYLVDGIGEIMGYYIKHNKPQSELLFGVNDFLKGIINKFNEFSKS